MNKQKLDIIRVVNSIAHKLTQEESKNNGLLQGSAGISIFFAYLFLYTKDEKYLVHSEKLITLSVDSVENGNISSCNFCDGISGIAWQIKHLIKIGFLEAEINDIISEEIAYLLNAVSTLYFKNGDYDYLHGGLGSAVFFLNRAHSLKERDRFQSILYSLDEIIEIKNDSFQFKNEFISKEYDLGLSHGISSIISILVKAIECDLSNERVAKLLSDTLCCLINRRDENGLSLYPNFVKEEKPYNSRLAWCYGDLGIASVFWQAGKVLKNREWKNEAIAIMLHSAKRRDLKENNVIDACFCHGTSGIAHIFNRFYKETGIKEFNAARWYWLKKTLDMADWNDGFADYKIWQGEMGWKKEFGLLEGVSGIGLVLLGFLTDDIKDLSWDECLLLS